MQVNAAVNSLLAPGSATNTLTPTVITSHALVNPTRLPAVCDEASSRSSLLICFAVVRFLFQTPVLLTPSPLPSTIHFWSTLSPIAPRSPAKLSFQVKQSVSVHAVC